MLGSWSAGTGRGFWAAYAACAVASMAPLWGVTYLPMVDLPQHAALVAAWAHLDDPAMGFADQFEIHAFTPYVLPYLLAVWLARALGVLVALKLLVSAAVLGLPLATLRLVARRGGDPWWALWAVPLAFGVCFRWGFLSNLVAAPLCLLFIDEGEAYARAPTDRRAVGLAALGVVLFFTHLIVLATGLAVVALLVAALAPGPRRALQRLWPLAAPVALAAAWAASAAGRDPRVREWEWDFTFARLSMLPQYLFDAPWPATLTVPVIDHGAATMALALVAAVLLARPRPSRDPVAWLPAAVAAGLFLLSPFSAFSSFAVADRFALFIVPLGLAALADGGASGPRRAARAVTLVAVLAWMASLTVAFRAFDRLEMGPFARVAAQVRPGPRLATLIYDAQSAHVRGVPVLMHVGGLIQAEKGGSFATNFGSYVNLPVQYRPGREPPHSDLIQWDPSRFDWRVDGQADTFLVRSREEPTRLFAAATVPVLLVAQEGDWWLFRRLGAAEGEGRDGPAR